MRLVLHGGIFRRHAERVPAHRMQDVEAARPLEPGDHIAHRIIAHVPHVDTAGRIWKHFQDVIFRPRVVVLGGEGRPLLPNLLPFRFGLARVVALGLHSSSIRSSRIRSKVLGNEHDLRDLVNVFGGG